jgi:hypothetical protein
MDIDTIQDLIIYFAGNEPLASLMICWFVGCWFLDVIWKLILIIQFELSRWF